MKLLKTCNASVRAAAPPMYPGPRNTLALSPPPLPPYAPLQASRTAQSQLVMSSGAAQYSAQAMQQQQLSWQTQTPSLLPGSAALSTTSAVDYGGLSPVEPPSAAMYSAGSMAMRSAGYGGGGGRSGRGVHSVPATPVSEMLANASMRSQGSGSVFTDGLSSAESGAGSNEMLVMGLGGGGGRGAGGSGGLVGRPGSSASSLSRGAQHRHHSRPSGLHADLLAAADNVTSAVTSLVRELNSEAESDGEGAERDRDTSASEPEPDPAELADPQLQSRLSYPGMNKFALHTVIILCFMEIIPS